LTLQSVATALGTTHTTILRYERGVMKPTVEVLRELARVYGCVPAELEFAPVERARGRRLHDAGELLREMDAEMADRWLELGRLLRR
jgi:transcriptional regulator with XRE-family HTH domain